MLKQKYFGSVRFDKNAIAFQSPCSSSHFKIMAPRVLVEEAVTVRQAPAPRMCVPFSGKAGWWPVPLGKTFCSHVLLRWVLHGLPGKTPRTALYVVITSTFPQALEDK